jgi:hypothetical protein
VGRRHELAGQPGLGLTSRKEKPSCEDGFGFAEAFGRTSVIRAMSAANQQQVLDLIFNRNTGAGLSILRLGISSTSSSIQPAAAEFAKIVGPLAGQAGVQLACCDPVGWNDQRSYAAPILADAEANRRVVTHTGHHYSSAPAAPLSVGGRPSTNSGRTR